MIRVLGPVVLVALLAASPAFAQQTPQTRVRGTVASDRRLTADVVKGREAGEMKVVTTDNLLICGMVPRARSPR